METNRPWGSYNVLFDSNNCKVKKINILPNKRLSLQSHKHRSEHWVIVEGTSCIIQVGDDKLTLHKNQYAFIPKGVKHRIENNTGSIVELIETQIGDYFGEDDIIRYEDDFGRV